MEAPVQVAGAKGKGGGRNTLCAGYQQAAGSHESCQEQYGSALVF